MTSLQKLAELGVTVEPGSSEPIAVEIADIDKLKWFLDMDLDEAGRAAHFDALFGSTGLGEGFSDQLVREVAAYAVGDAQLSESSREAVAPAFPIRLAVFADPGPITVSGKKDLSTGDGTSATAIYTDVTMEPGGYFYCSATTLFFTCDSFTRAAPIGSGNDFAIVGKVGATPGKPATPGGAGQAQNGSPGECSSGGIAGHGGTKGDDGGTGTKGTDGGRGLDGTPSQPATIWVKSPLKASQLMIFTQSGPGGTGGNGGDGGQGQQGGNGGNGVSCGCTGNAGAVGGSGGRGGKGGRAGDGGNGADAVGNITVYVATPGDQSKVQSNPQGAPAGQPGTPGGGGPAGIGGAKSNGGKHNDGGDAGGKGVDGDSGDAGNAGTVTGKAANVVPMVR